MRAPLNQPTLLHTTPSDEYTCAHKNTKTEIQNYVNTQIHKVKKETKCSNGFVQAPLNQPTLATTPSDAMRQKTSHVH